MKSRELQAVGQAGVEEIFLAEVNTLCAEFLREVRVIVEDQRHARRARDGENEFRQASHFIACLAFGAKLDDVRAAVAELSRKVGRVAAVQIGRVNERVKMAVGEAQAWV